MTRRPGGRSARVRAAVHEAVTQLAAERGYGKFTVAEVAARAGVADTSVYRRWGGLEELTADVVITWLTTCCPVPDTGTLVGDLRTYAANVVREANGPQGPAVLGLVIALGAAGEAGARARDQFLAERSRQLRTMLERARARGEQAPDVAYLVDQILAPVYVRSLFAMGPLTEDFADELVDRMLGRVLGAAGRGPA
ncbi:TetR family transcriptional regulator [Actinosynnema sp. ALI-1.44]|nr:TetR family transcriptional regulator [Actinosynnema sp. ALI-1.44]